MQAMEHTQKLVPEYAVRGDFCRVFAEDMNHLFTLSLLLTGGLRKAEECFAAALEDCVGQTRVFKEWARRWALRAVMQNAIRMMRPLRKREIAAKPGQPGTENGLAEGRVPLEDILRLKTFERLVLVMSVLERCSDHECAVLLGCSRHDLVLARSRAFAQISALGEAPTSDRTSGMRALFTSTNLVAKTA